MTLLYVVAPKGAVVQYLGGSCCGGLLSCFGEPPLLLGRGCGRFGDTIPLDDRGLVLAASWPEFALPMNNRWPIGRRMFRLKGKAVDVLGLCKNPCLSGGPNADRS